MLLGVEIVKDPESKEPGNKEAARIMTLCMNYGLLINCRAAYGNSNVLRIVPPFCTTDEQLQRAAEILAKVIREVAGES